MTEWPLIELGRVVRIRKGTTTPTHFPKETFELYSIPGFDVGEPELLSGSDIKSNKTNICPGDVLFSKLNPRIPRVWIVPPKTEFRQICSTEFWPLVWDQALLDPHYLRYYLITPRVRERLAPSTEAATKSRSRIKPFQLLAETIPLPTLSEQRRIVEILDQADRLRRLRAEADGKAERILPALFIKMFGDPATNPMGWMAKTFRELLTEPPRNGLSPSSAGTFRAKILTLSAITGAAFDETAVKHSYFRSQPSANKKVNPQDFLVCRGNGNLGLVGRARFPRQPLDNTLFPDTIIAAKVDPKKVDRAYLESLWHTKWMRSQIESRSTTTSGIHKINQTTLGSLPVKLPPIALQTRFGALANTLCRSLQIRRSETLERLSVSLNYRAFLGDLTISWRNAHMNELLQEMEQQAKAIDMSP